MRVISGIAGRLRLDAPKSIARPSTDRLREALFSILSCRLEGARVLDLFAGSGALGIEALSRGARRATFVDRDRAAVHAIGVNLKRTGLESAATVLNRDVFRWIGQAEERFDLVLADPPYCQGPRDHDLAAALLCESHLNERLTENGLLVIETGQSAAPAHDTERWLLEEQRAYGRSHLHFFTRKG